ncbi:MAG: gliding motility-associated C-terminal domain-containing protein [Flavobacteriia bacterium]
MKHLVVFLFLLFLYQNTVAQELLLHPNRGQWDNEILYSMDLSQGHLFVDSNGFTFSLNDAISHSHDHQEEEKVACQVVKMHFYGNTWSGQKTEEKESQSYRNYYLGSDSSKWKSGIKSFQEVRLNDFYAGIDLLMDATSSKMKYSFEVAAGVDPSKIRYGITGSDNIEIQDGSIIIATRFGNIIEEKPVAWTEKEGKKVFVAVDYVIDEQGIISYDFPQGYDRNAKLVIDPYLVFSTFSGSTMDNWGMTATPDSQGNLYAGGIVFNMAGNYPTTTGAFDVTFNGGYNYTYTSGNSTYNMSGFDIAISKFDPNGTSLVYSTYIGGAGNEAPHSLVTDESANLYVFGVTGSSNFPVVNGCFDVTFNGGPVIAENELGYNGADIYVTRFNAAGSALVGSTFVGGTGTDGINVGTLNYNYGDPFRGEIIVENGFVFVTSSTQSSDFPTLGASQGSLNGIQDAIIFKMNASLTALAWSTYFGGSGLESGNSIQLASNGNVYVVGGTSSSGLSLLSGEDLSFNGGISDGYLLKLQGTSAVVLAGTYMGLSEYDQAYFVQLDLSDNVYVYGQSESSWTMSSGVYGTPNSGQFIRKYNNSLSTTLWTTMIGAGSGHPEISPTAFLVSDCYDIYLSGWGGTINSANSNQAAYSTTNGFQTSLDAYQATTNGSNFYIAVLDQDAASLKYATFMGGASSSFNHVDGGTSRFDKSGRIYHAVCGACGGNDYGFTSTPGVWSPTNQSPNCNLAAFKFELSTIEAIISEPQTLICLPDPVEFDNNSANGNSFYWDFGDGSNSTLVNPSHVYPGPGNYTVSLVVSDSNGCFTPDSISFVVNIGDFQGGVIQPTQPICPGIPYQMEAYGGAFYEWSPAEVLDDPTSPTPIATINETTLFTVVISDSCGTDTVTATLPVYIVNTSVSNDTSVCIGNSAFLEASGGISYVWSPIETLSNPTIFNPIATPDVYTEYSVIITTAQGCKSFDTVSVSVFYDPPVPILDDTTQMCRNSFAEITASGGDTYLWSPNYQINSVTSSTVIVSPADDFTYICNFYNACGFAVDSIFIDVVDATITGGNDTTICPGGNATMWGNGGVMYNWYPDVIYTTSTGSLVSASPDSATTYLVIGTDSNGCIDSAFVSVQLYTDPNVTASIDVYAVLGDQVEISAYSQVSGFYQWSPAENVSCVNCPTTIAITSQNTTYTILFTDQNGCTDTDEVTVHFEPIIYVPNTFTPNDDENNQGFQVIAKNITDFQLLIFNRWGELIYEMTDLQDYWDGSYKGLKCQDGTYVWKLTYTDLMYYRSEMTGHVNLIR